MQLISNRETKATGAYLKPTQLQQQLTNEGEIMLEISTKEIEIAIRLYENLSYGTTYAKGLFRRAVFNGTADTKNPTNKYLLDFYSYEDWCNQAKSDGQMEVIRAVVEDKHKLYSWVKHYDKPTMQKKSVGGYCSLDMQSLDMNLLICDEVNAVEAEWQIAAKPCKQGQSGTKSPQLLATNADLAVW
jgi:hypothetical protein